MSTSGCAECTVGAASTAVDACTVSRSISSVHRATAAVDGEATVSLSGTLTEVLNIGCETEVSLDSDGRALTASPGSAVVVTHDILLSTGSRIVTAD